MKHLLTILILTCATLHAQTVIVKGTGAGAVHATGAGSVRGYIIPATYTNYSDGRFTVWNTNQDVVIDNDSGLMWARDANIDGTKDWTNAIAYCSSLTYATHSDWRLPGVTNDAGTGEWNDFVDAYPSANNPALPLGHPFTSVQSDYYWSDLTCVSDASRAWIVSLDSGYIAKGLKSLDVYVWPCRGP